MYTQDAESDKRGRIRKIRDRASLWALFWTLLVVAFCGLLIGAGIADVEKSLKIMLGTMLVVSGLCDIVMIKRVARFTRYLLNRTSNYPINDYNRIYR